MARPGSEHPTELELEILKVLWRESPLLVRDVLARMFNGDSAAMVLNLIDTAGLDAEELNEIRKLVSRKTKEQKQ